MVLYVYIQHIDNWEVWMTNRKGIRYQFVCLMSHGTVKVSRPSEVEQSKGKFTVGHNVNIDPSVLHMAKRRKRFHISLVLRAHFCHTNYSTVEAV